MKSSTALILFLLLFTLYFATLIGNVQYHENLHRLVFRSYNIPVEIEYKWEKLYNPINWFKFDIPLGVTTPKGVCPESCDKQHVRIEELEYLIQTIDGVFLSLGVFFIAYKLLNEKEDKGEGYDSYNI